MATGSLLDQMRGAEEVWVKVVSCAGKVKTGGKIILLFFAELQRVTFEDFHNLLG